MAKEQEPLMVRVEFVQEKFERQMKAICAQANREIEAAQKRLKEANKHGE